MSPFAIIRHLVASPWVRAAVLLGPGMGLVAGFFAVRPDLWMVERVVFEGVHHAGPGALRHLADIRNGTTIWSVDLDAAERGVERHPWVRSARATRQWPDAVVVEIEEYRPVAVLHYDDLYYVDAEGRPFLRGDLPDLDFPQITGIGPELERLHPALPGLALRDALALIDALCTRGLVEREDISEVAFSETRGFTVQLAGSRVLFGLDDPTARIDRLQTLVDRGEVALDQPLWIDLAPAQIAIVRPLALAGA